MMKDRHAFSTLKRFWRELTYPGVEEEKAARQEYMTRVIFALVTVALLVMTIVVIVLTYWLNEPVEETVIIMLSMDVLVIIGWLLIFLQHWYISSYILPGIFLVYSTYMVVTRGMVTTAVLQLAIVVLLVGMLSGNRARWISLFVCVVLYLLAGWVYGERELEEFLVLGILVSMSLSGIALLEQFFSNLLNNSLRIANQREAELRSIFRAAPIGIGLVIDRVIQEANDMLCQMTGYSRQELVGQSARMLYPSQEEFEYVGMEKYRQIREKELGTVETRWQRKNGEIRDILLSSVPLDAGDLSKGVTFSALDITERKQAEQALIESEERYRQAVDNSPNPIFSIDGAGYIQTWNQACKKTFHYEQSILGQHYRVLLQNAEDRFRIESMLSKLQYGESLSDIDIVYRCQNGDEYIMVSRIYPIYDRGEEIQGYVFANTDVTKRRLAEQALRKSEEQYRLLFDQMLSGFALHEIICDEGGTPIDYRFLAVNSAFEDLTGLKADEIIGKMVREVFPETEPFWIRRYGRVALEGGTDQFNGYSASLGKHYEARAFCPEPGKLAVMFHDITERMKAEIEVRKSKQALEEAEKQVHLGHFEILVETGKATWSDEIFNILGLDPKETEPTAEIFNEMVHSEDRARVQKAYEKSKKDRVPFDLMYRIQRKDGDIRYVRSSASVINDETANSKLFGIFQDITELKEVELALQESETLYHDLVETAQDLIWQCDLEGRYTYLNPAWETVFGYKVEEMLGRPFTDFQTPEVADRDGEIFATLLKGSMVKRYETVHLGKEGQQIHLVFNAKSIFDERGNIIGTRGTAYDITDRKRAETALMKSENLLRESQKIAHIGHYELDILSGTWKGSDGLNEIFGIDREYQTDVGSWLQIVHPDDQERMATYFAEEVVEQRQNFDAEYRIVRVCDGETRWVKGLGKLLFDNRGNPIHMIGNIQDITESKQAEIALRESADRYRAVVENQTEFIVRWKPDGTRTFANEAYLRFYDISLEKALTNNFMSLIFEEDRFAVQQKMARLLSGETQSETDIHRVIKPDGSLGWQEWTDHAIFDEQGKIIEFQSVGRDITERKQAEIAFRESEERLRRLASAAHEGVVFTEEGKIIEANEQLAKILGCEMSELIGMSVMEFVAPESQELVLEKIKSGEEGPYEHLAMRRDGSIFPVEIRGRTVNMQGRRVRVTAILDVSERKLVEESLRIKTAELEALFSISAHLRSAQSAEAMLPVVIEEMRRVLQSDANAVILLNSDGANFTYALGDGSLSINDGMTFSVQGSISGMVLQTRQPYVTRDLSSDPYKAPTVQGDQDLGPAIVVPVVSEVDFLGVLLCARKKDIDARMYSIPEVRLLMAIGEMVGNALRRARLFDQAMKRLQNLQTLHSIDTAISANLDLNVILEVLLTQGVNQLNVDAACVLLLDSHAHILRYAAGKGFRSPEIKSTRLRLGEGLPAKAVLERKIIYIPNLPGENHIARKFLLEDGFVCYQAAPLIAKGQLQGVLEIFNRSPMSVDDEQTGFLETLAIQAAIAIDNSQLFSDLQRSNFELEMAYDATIEGWSRALELRDQETEGHSLRVTDMTLQLAQEIGVRDASLIHIRRGALLHDIGKMGVPDRILLKPDKLIGEEWETMKRHTVYAHEMLWPIEFLRPAIDIPYCHHERWDGSGYPRQLKGEQIPLSARLFAVADVWDALTSERPYRKAWSEEHALDYIVNNRGKHFDPQIVELFLIQKDRGKSPTV